MLFTFPICPRVLVEPASRRGVWILRRGTFFRVERKRGPAWYAKYRLPDGRQVQRKLGPAWTDRGRPGAGRFTRRVAEDWWRDTLDQARGTPRDAAGGRRTGVTVADAAAEWLRDVAEDRDVKPSTLIDYRSVVPSRLLPEFGELPVEQITPDWIEAWRASLGAGRPLTNRTSNKAVTILGGVMERARRLDGLPSNPVRDLEKLRERHDVTLFDFFSPAYCDDAVRRRRDGDEQDRGQVSAEDLLCSWRGTSRRRGGAAGRPLCRKIPGEREPESRPNSPVGCLEPPMGQRTFGLTHQR